jgi:hypothetical protein
VRADWLGVLSSLVSRHQHRNLKSISHFSTPISSSVVHICVQLSTALDEKFARKTDIMEPNDRKISNSDLSAQAYNALNSFFFSHEDEVVEIEMLPPAIQPVDGLVMQDAHNLGIPKKVLVAAYIKARQLFFEGIAGGATSLVSRLSPIKFPS